MCTGEIVAPAGKKREEISFSLAEFLKKFWISITKPVVIDPNQPKVNMCIKCGDLEIGGEWQRIPHPQKSVISKEVEAGRLAINGRLAVCNFCVSMEKVIKEKGENIYKDNLLHLEFDAVQPLSSMSF